ncbi:MAG: DNA cytosine methyltransferase [Phreatobacter sp.]|uniref:DNA cytosine methyltransferase n=1 Tax=Phreatobacter sp. TaxID=1966341 RepID=UPI001A5D29A9|nr:DNA cytosine methyltransferase [Phreatobacter sp.]MBL8567930.1 DNA cytosine methyltransferase [Phreatobacter sp.]
MHKFYEFFAGGGMARSGLGPNWQCLFANDFDHKKSAVYRANWGDSELRTADVRQVTPADLPDHADLVWGSFPCQDLSLAGGGAGLRGDRSGTFWPFWNLMKAVAAEGRAPKLVVLENVCGTLTSHGGQDFVAICKALNDAKYQFGAMVIDASLFVPHSRPRLFIVAVRGDMDIPAELVADKAIAPWSTKGLVTAYERLPANVQANWVWWNLKAPSRRNSTFADLIEENPSSVAWHSSEETKRLLDMMGPVHRKKIQQAKKAGKRLIGGVYKRTRFDADGFKVQRAEVRFDDIAGCLRTPAGGSSRQLIVVVDGDKVRSRLISSRETARLMGLSDSYILPENYNEAYHLTGDGVVVPVVRHLASEILEPLLDHDPLMVRAAA